MYNIINGILFYYYCIFYFINILQLHLHILILYYIINNV